MWSNQLPTENGYYWQRDKDEIEKELFRIVEFRDGRFFIGDYDLYPIDYLDKLWYPIPIPDVSKKEIEDLENSYVLHVKEDGWKTYKPTYKVVSTRHGLMMLPEPNKEVTINLTSGSCVKGYLSEEKCLWITDREMFPVSANDYWSYYYNTTPDFIYDREIDWSDWGLADNEYRNSSHHPIFSDSVNLSNNEYFYIVVKGKINTGVLMTVSLPLSCLSKLRFKGLPKIEMFDTYFTLGGIKYSIVDLEMNKLKQKDVQLALSWQKKKLQFKQKED